MSLLNRLRCSSRILHRTQQLPMRRHGHFIYRGTAPAPRKNQVIAQSILGVMWFWILWRFYHEPEDVFNDCPGHFLNCPVTCIKKTADFTQTLQSEGHFQLPDPSLWTDEELGIPADDED